jgi:hypothetical protein
MSRCRSCGAQILWAFTPKGKTIPVEVVPSPKGNLRLFRDYNGQGDNRVEYVSGSELNREAGVLYVSHFVTCPNAEAWRRRR